MTDSGLGKQSMIQYVQGKQVDDQASQAKEVND